MTTCPTCNTYYDVQPQCCATCGFPFLGTEKEKSVFIGQQIVKKGHIADTKKRIKVARIILWIIGGVNTIMALFFILQNNLYRGIEVLLVGLLFIWFGFYTCKKPLISILIPFVLLLLSYTANAIVAPALLLDGLLWKVLSLLGLLIALVSVIKAEKLKKESEFLKAQKL
jgi:hypothetical protein